MSCFLQASEHRICMLCPFYLIKSPERYEKMEYRNEQGCTKHFSGLLTSWVTLLIIACNLNRYFSGKLVISRMFPKLYICANVSTIWLLKSIKHELLSHLLWWLWDEKHWKKINASVEECAIPLSLTHTQTYKHTTESLRYLFKPQQFSGSQHKEQVQSHISRTWVAQVSSQKQSTKHDTQSKSQSKFQTWVQG